MPEDSHSECEQTTNESVAVGWGGDWGCGLLGGVVSCLCLTDVAKILLLGYEESGDAMITIG